MSTSIRVYITLSCEEAMAFSVLVDSWVYVAGLSVTLQRKGGYLRPFSNISTNVDESIMSRNIHNFMPIFHLTEFQFSWS